MINLIDSCGKKTKKKNTYMPWTMTLADSTNFTLEDEEIEKYLDVVWGWNLYLLCKIEGWKKQEIKDFNEIMENHE